MLGTHKALREKGDGTISTIIHVILIVFCFLCLYPFWYVIVASFNEGYDMMSGGFTGGLVLLHCKTMQIFWAHQTGLTLFKFPFCAQ